MFDSENASSPSLADGIADILRQVRTNGPDMKGAKALQAGNNTPYLPPIATQDDQGKTIPKYRMGMGQRILGTLANFANGFARSGSQPVYVGPGALNNRYYRDEAYREQQNQDRTQRTADQFRNTIDYRTIVQDAVTGKWKARTYGGEVREIETPPWAAPSGEQQQDENNNDAPVQQPSEEEEPERYVSTPARRRFEEMRRNKFRR